MDKQTYMYSLVEQWKESGLTKGEFTKQQSVSYHSFNHWLKKYNKQHSIALDKPEFTFFTAPENKISAIKKSSLKKELKTALCIELPNGIKISIY